MQWRAAESYKLAHLHGRECRLRTAPGHNTTCDTTTISPPCMTVPSVMSPGLSPQTMHLRIGCTGQPLHSD